MKFAPEGSQSSSWPCPASGCPLDGIPGHGSAMTWTGLLTPCGRIEPFGRRDEGIVEPASLGRMQAAARTAAAYWMTRHCRLL